MGMGRRRGAGMGMGQEGELGELQVVVPWTAEELRLALHPVQDEAEDCERRVKVGGVNLGQLLANWKQKF